MSRIYEALKHASQGAVLGSSAAVANGVESSALERYLPEESPAEVRQPDEPASATPAMVADEPAAATANAGAPAVAAVATAGAGVAGTGVSARVDAAAAVREPAVASVPVDVAVAAADPPRRVTLAPAKEFEGKVIAPANMASVSAEQYRGVATVLHETQMDRGLKSVLVTSVAPGEGKTLTAVNLALTLSESYARRVLIIDADLRRPSVHRVLGVPGQRGLREALARPSGELPLIELSPQVSVLPAGAPEPNPLPRLSSDRMQTLIEQCVSRFDWVVVDAAPLATAQDAHVLTRFVRGVIFVIRAGVVPFSAVERAISELGRESIIGTVLNAADPRDASASLPYSYSA